MNLHVTSDSYGLYPSRIARRILESGNAANNLLVNLYEKSEIKHEKITYIEISDASYREYISQLRDVKKVIFHPYNILSYAFLKLLLKRFPNIKIYWVVWSYELYNLPQFVHKLYEPFSAKYLKNKYSRYVKAKIWIRRNINSFLILVGVKKSNRQILKYLYSRVHYFLSPLPSDYFFLKETTSNTSIQYLPFAYLSLEQIMPDLISFRSTGNKIMIGHSASPDGNHYELIHKLYNMNPGYSFFLPLVYGDEKYSKLIKSEARQKFKNIEILEEKLNSTAYYKKLMEVGWAIFSVKVQQGFGNIMGLIWMGVKVFLDENSSTYKDFSSWGIKVFSIQRELNEKELTNKLRPEEIENNRRIIFEKLNEKKVNEYWKQILY